MELCCTVVSWDGLSRVQTRRKHHYRYVKLKAARNHGELLWSRRNQTEWSASASVFFGPEQRADAGWEVDEDEVSNRSSPRSLARSHVPSACVW